MKSLIPVALALLVGAGWAAGQAPAPANQLPPAPSAQPVLGQAAVPSSPSAPGLSQAVNGCPAGGPSVYFSADYLLWKIREGAVPPTVTTVPVGLLSVSIGDRFVDANGNLLTGLTNASSVIGFAPVSIVSNTQTGLRSFDYGDQSGFRLTAGWWADSDCLFGLEASYFMLNRGSDSFSAVAAVSGNQFLVNTGFTRNTFVVQGGTQTLIG